MHQTYPNITAYNCPALLKIDSLMDQQAIESACAAFIKKHTVFMLRFGVTDGNVFQWLGCEQAIRVKLHDVSNFSDEQVIDLSRELAKKPFDLGTGPLLRVNLLTKSEECHWLLLTTNHIVCDGNSFYVLLRDFFACYLGCVEGEELDVKPDTPSYSEFILEETDFIGSEEGKRRLEFWKDKVYGIGLAEGLVPDKPRPAVLSFSGATHSRNLGEQLSGNISNFISGNRITAPTLFLAAYALLLKTYSGKEQVVIGLPTAGRSESFRDHVGYFSNMVPLVLDVNSKTKRSEFLQTVKSELIRSVSSSYPFTQLVQSLGIEASLSCYPIFCHTFVFQDLSAYGASSQLLSSLAPRLSVKQIQDINQEGEYELVLEVVKRSDHYEVNLKYNPDLYYPETIHRLVEQLEGILEHMISSMESSITDYLRLPKKDLDKIIDWNRTSQDLGDPHVLHRLFEDQSKSHPNFPAVSLAGQHITYLKLDAKANTLAAKFQEYGIRRSDFVGLYMYRSFDMIISLIAILKTGGAYVPIDPDFPQERIDFIIKDSKSKVVVCQEDTLKLINDSQTIELSPENWAHWQSDNSLSFNKVEVKPSDAAYVIYTSGSTGTPKGCLIEHRAVCNRILWMQDEFSIDDKDSVLQKTPYSFDVSVWEFFWPLIVGARMVLAKPGGHKLPTYLAKLIVDEKISICHFVPSMLNVFVEAYDMPGKLNLKYLFTSGEALTNSQLGKTTKIILGPLLIFMVQLKQQLMLPIGGLLIEMI